MEFHTCKPALIISPKCEISGVNPGLFSHEFSEKVCSSENSAGTLQTPHWSPRLALGKAETMGLKGLIATDLSLRMFYWYQVPKTLMRQTSQKQMKLILLLLSLLKCSETQWCCESTPGDSQAVLPNKMCGFIDEVTASEISPVDWEAQVSKMRRQKNVMAYFSFLFFLMELEI